MAYPTVFPGAIDSYTAKTDGVDDVMAVDVNELQSAIVAIETKLGIGALTAGRLPYVSAAGGITDSANATLDSSGNAGFSGKVVAKNIYYAQYSISDDTAISFTPAMLEGVVLLNSRTSGLQTINGIVAYRTEATVFTTAMVVGANLNVTTGVLSGTTGTDGKATVSVHTDGKIYVENRMGGTAYITITLLGS